MQEDVVDSSNDMPQHLWYEVDGIYPRGVLTYIADMRALLQSSLSSDTLSVRVVTIACKILQFRRAILYLSDDQGGFLVRAASGMTPEQEYYLQQHPVPKRVVTLFFEKAHNLSESYFISTESPLWLDDAFACPFAVMESAVEEPMLALPPSLPGAYPFGQQWCAKDLIGVPLVSAGNEFMGFLLLSSPVDGRRPVTEMMAFLEVFVHQAAMILERMRLSAEVQRGREERAALSQALVQAQEAEQFKNQVLRAASDGLRTPLTVIQGYLELLRDDHLIENDAQKTRLLTKASLACEELILRLGNVVDANYIDRNQEMLSLGSVNVQRSVQSILDIFGPIIARDKRTVTARVAENICVQADSLRLSQILFTIMSNALEHTPIASKIAIDVECVSDEMLYQRAWFVEQQLARPVAEFFVVLAIRDWGKGIKKEDQQRLFMKGTYSSAALEGTQQKAGVGLYLSRQLLEAMGGYIWVESSGIPGEGAQFLIALPRSDEKK